MLTVNHTPTTEQVVVTLDVTRQLRAVGDFGPGILTCVVAAREPALAEKVLDAMTKAIDTRDLADATADEIKRIARDEIATAEFVPAT